MTRKELYDHIKGLGLQDHIKNVAGKNYTQVPNEVLETIVIQVISTKDNCNCDKNVKKKPETDGNICGCKVKKLWKFDEVEGMLRLVSVLSKKHILLDSEVNFILQNTENN